MSKVRQDAGELSFVCDIDVAYVSMSNEDGALVLQAERQSWEGGERRGWRFIESVD